MNILRNYQFFQNKKCEYFPCKKVENLNCLFCFCPLYYNKDCGGNYKILDNGWKDCSSCLILHKEDGYEYVLNKLKEFYPKKVNFLLVKDTQYLF